MFLIFFQGYPAFLNPFSAEDFVINYLLLPVFVLFVVFWKVFKKTKFVKLQDMDIWSGRRHYGDVAEVPDAEVGKGNLIWKKARRVFVG